MALFVIERNFAEQLDLDQEAIDANGAYNADADLRWLFVEVSDLNPGMFSGRSVTGHVRA